MLNQLPGKAEQILIFQKMIAAVRIY